MHIGVDLRPLMTPKKTGVAQYTKELLENVFKLDSQNHYWLFYNSCQSVKLHLPNFSGANIHWVKLNWPNKIFNLAIILKLIKIDRFIPQKLDYWYSPNLNFTRLSAGAKHIITIHDLSFEFFPEFFTAKQLIWHKLIQPKKQCRQAYQIITPSINTKRDLINFYQITPTKIKVIYPGINNIFNTAENDLARQKIIVQKKYSLPENYILYFGAIEPRKNIIKIIRSFEKISKQIAPNYHLILAGANGWKNNDIYRCANNSALKDKIKFLGYISEEDKPALYALSKLFVYPSFYEGFGFPPQEAMELGIPTIVSTRSSLFEVGENSVVYVNPHNIGEMSNLMANILNNKKLHDYFSIAGKQQTKKYRSTETARQFIQTFNCTL